MKTNLATRTWLAIIAGCWITATALGQITFVKTSQAPATPANRQTQQGGLSPEKKKSLSKYGPEDAFPGASEQENQQRQTNRTNPRRSGATASPTTTPAPAATASPTPTPIVTTPSPDTSIPTPATMTNNAASASTTSSAPKSSGSGLVLLTLATASLLVFGALVYVVRLLRNKLKETR